jgi:ferredoxin
MIRNIIRIDEEKCNGCSACVNACHEGALQLIDGKARLVSESYCDGLGNCLPECPTGAITIEEREVNAYDREAVKNHMNQTKVQPVTPLAENILSQLGQWPCQLKLVPVNAPYLNNAHLLIAADCTAFAYANIHQKFMPGKITLIGCPKLDDIDYSEKLTAIFEQHGIKSITILRMEVPCCGGIVHAVTHALKNSGKMIPWSVITISTDGKILEE